MASKPDKPIESPEHAHNIAAYWITRFHSTSIFGDKGEFDNALSFCATAAFYEVGGVGQSSRLFRNAVWRYWRKELKAHGYYQKAYNLNGKFHCDGWRRLPVFTFSQLGPAALARVG